MSLDIIEEDLPDSPDKNKFNTVALGLFLLGLFVLAVGAGLFFFKGKQNSDIKILSASASVAPSGEIMVHVDGAVKSPGVYKLSSDSRVKDAVAAAGGLASEADEAKINLAAKVADGQKIHIASQSEAVGNTQQATSSESNLININTASEAELDKLPGIGPVTAAKIINLRPYGAVEELLSKKAVSSSVYGKIKDLISL